MLGNSMQFKDVDFGMIIFVMGYHALLLILLPWYFLKIGVPSYGIILSTLIMYILTGLGVSAGYHRLYSHRSYRVNKAVEWVIVLLATLSLQGSIIRWSYKHRLHHQYVDTDKDPYSIKKGFWHAHLFWMFEKQKENLNSEIILDLRKNKLLIFQHKYNVSLIVILNILSILFFGFVFKDYLGAFVFTFLARTFLVHHSTFFINSLAHTWGSKPYSHEQTAVNNWILAILTFGEGYHNYHHTYPADYRNGVRWWHFDPTKLLIWLMNKISLVENLVKVDKYRIKSKLVAQDKILLLEKLGEKDNDRGGVLEDKINELSESLIKKFNEIIILKKKLKELKALKLEMPSKELFKDAKNRIRDGRRSVRKDMREWKKICVHVIKLNRWV